MDIKGFKSNDGTIHKYDYKELANLPDTEGTPDGCEDGGYYTPAVTQPSDNTLSFAFTPSKSDMPAVQPVQVTLPAGTGSGGNVELDATLTQSGKAADAKAVGDALANIEAGGVNWTDPEDEESFGESGTEGEPEPDPEPDNPDDPGDEPGGGETSYVTDNLAVMYDFTRYEDGYQGEVEDLSGNGVVPTIEGLEKYADGMVGFIGGRLRTGAITIDCDAVKSHPYSIEVYGFLRKGLIKAADGTISYYDTSAPSWWNMMVARTDNNATITTSGWKAFAWENTVRLAKFGDSPAIEETVELSIGGVNNANVTGADTHLVYCVDGNQQKIYLNGVLVASSTSATGHASDNILKLFNMSLACDLKMFRLYKSVLSDFDVYSNYLQAVSDYSGTAAVALAAEATEESTEEDTITRKPIKEMDNFPVTLARAVYMNNSNTTVEDEILKLKNGGANSATVVRSAEVGDTGIVSFKNAAGITVFEADLAHMNVGALQLPRVYLTGSTVEMGKDSPVKMAFKFVDAEQTITGWADVEWQGNTSR